MESDTTGLGWFKRNKEGITTSTKDKKDIQKGLWHKCSSCSAVDDTQDFINNYWVCKSCNYHERIGSLEYFQILFDDNKFEEINKNMESDDPLNFTDSKKYTTRLKDTQKKTNLKDAVRTAYGKLDGEYIVIAAMDFSFIGGSMGSVVGEKISRAIDYAIKKKTPFLMVSKSGGARMMEAGLALLQLAKTSSKLLMFSRAKLPYISFLTDPTTGGVTASFAMLGDINIAEPKALIGFAGPRVVKETIGKDLPEGFQRSEFVLEHGFLDFIVERKNLKSKIGQFLKMMRN
jgi:acetyl-CoA carboxylase carboxyl transferase subunit beta